MGIADSWWSTAWSDGIGLSAVVAILVGVHTNRSGARLTWWLLWHGTETSDQTMARADHALYQAKQAGRNQVRPASPPATPHRLDHDPTPIARLATADRPTT